MKRKVLLLQLLIWVAAMFPAFTQVALNELSDFQQPVGNWNKVEKVRMDSNNPAILTFENGNDCIINGVNGKAKYLVSKNDYQDIELHVEFLLPKGSNSGVSFQSRYEVQIFDSWEKSNLTYYDCGGIFQGLDSDKKPGEDGFDGHAPIENASKAPGEWQSFDITFRAPVFDEEGKKIKNAVFEKVILNGILVQDNVEVFGPLKGSKSTDEVTKAPFRLQGGHGPVAFKNIKVKELEPRTVQTPIHPRIYINNKEKKAFLDRIDNSEKVTAFLDKMKAKVEPKVEQHISDPEWIISRLQMYWKTKYKEVYVKGMDFSHGVGEAPVPTVRFSGSRDWATDYMRPKLEDVIPYMDDERGLYLQNKIKEGQPWEWVKASETGHIIEGINKEVLHLASDAAFLYWLYGEEKYAVFASDILTIYLEGLYHRDPPKTIEDHKNAKLMGLQTFEVIHEGVIEHVTLCYDFLYDYLIKQDANLEMMQDVFRKWADQEIKYGVPHNNWNLMQAGYITYLALALESNDFYSDGKGQEYYIDQVLNQNSEKQKALRDVVNIYDPNTAIWPETSGYSQGVTKDILEVFTLMDKSLNNNLLEEYPTIEKAALASFNYLFPNGFSVAYGDAKHQRLRFGTLEMLISNYRKYGKKEKEALISGQLKRFIEEGGYSRNRIRSLFNLFFNVGELLEVPASKSISSMVSPSFYSPNVSWIVQRNGHSYENGMMVSKNASLGNHSHANGINIELFAKGMVIAPDCAAGASYWTDDHNEYYSRFPAHNTVIVDGISDYITMRGDEAFAVNSIYPTTDVKNPLFGDFTLSDVSFTEPATGALQQRVTATVRTGEISGYFIDIFRSVRKDGKDKKHEYLFHAQGERFNLKSQGEKASSLAEEFGGEVIEMTSTDELSSRKGDLIGYDYFKNKHGVEYSGDFVAEFKMPSKLGEIVHLNVWMKGYKGREIFSVEAPPSKAVLKQTVPAELYRKPLPTMIVRQNGEAHTKPFVAIIDAFNQSEGNSVKGVEYFSSNNINPGFVGVKVHSSMRRQDVIFNDSNPDFLNNFDGGFFQGRMAILTDIGNELYSIFLNDVNSIEFYGIGIEIPEGPGNVLLKLAEGGFEMDAPQPFILSLDNEQYENLILELEGSNGRQLIEKKIIQTEEGKKAVFELPALNRKKVLIGVE